MADPNRVYGILQRITAGSDFNGADPGTTPVIEENLKKYPAAAVGGLFDPAHVNPILIRNLSAKMGGQASWTLSMTDGTDTVTITSGTTEAELNLKDIVIVPVNWQLKLVTTGASGAMTALMVFERAHVLL